MIAECCETGGGETQDTFRMSDPTQRTMTAAVIRDLSICPEPSDRSRKTRLSECYGGIAEQEQEQGVQLPSDAKGPGGIARCRTVGF